MPRSAPSGSKSRPAVSRTVEATTDAMSAVRWSMRVVREARDRAEKRVESLVGELAAAKQKMTEATDREKRLRRTFDDLRAENARISSELSRIKKESGQMRLRTKDLSSKSETLMRKLDKARSDAESERRAVEDRLSQECRHLKSELGAATETIDNLNAQVAMARGLNEDLRFNLDTSRETHEEVKQMVSELLESGQRTISEIEEALLTSPAPTT